MDLSSLIAQLIFTTVRITTIKPDGPGLGTGFMYTGPDSAGNPDLWLVTNRHVVADALGVTLHFIGGEVKGEPVLGEEVSFGVQASTFVGHPDPDIDVAVMRAGSLFADLHNSFGQKIFWRSIDSKMAATTEILEDFEPIEPVMFIGYPNGLHDQTSLLPIVRHGHSATPLTVDYEGKPTFLIDGSVFPGSSGSPVFLYVPASMPDKRGNISVGPGPRCFFLGLVASVYEQDTPVLVSKSDSNFVKDSLDVGIVYKAAVVDQATRSV